MQCTLDMAVTVEIQIEVSSRSNNLSTTTNATETNKPIYLYRDFRAGQHFYK